jgi:hypothetical protein
LSDRQSAFYDWRTPAAERDDLPRFLRSQSEHSAEQLAEIRAARHALRAMLPVRQMLEKTVTGGVSKC